MFTRIRNSYRLVKQSWGILRQDRELMLFPIMSGIASFVAMASFIVPFALYGLGEERAGAAIAPLWYVLLFVFYLVTYFITVFFNVGLMHCAAIRMDGGDPTVREGLKGALSQIGAIFTWAAISATVGLILRILEEKAEIVGRIVSGVLGLAWTLLTYFVVPVMIFERKGVKDSIKRSAELFKKTWGNAVVGEVGMGLFFFLLSLLGLIPFTLGLVLILGGDWMGAVAFVASAVLYWIALGIVSSTLSGIFHVVLYRYAASGTVPTGFSRELIEKHWRPKG